MNSKGEILVLGNFGLETGQLDGQTVKTRMVHRLLEQKSGRTVPFFDTGILQKRKISILILIAKLLKCKKLIYMPAQKNLQLFLPVLCMVSFFTRAEVYYIVVGGWLMSFIDKNKGYLRYLKKMRQIFPESELMAGELRRSYDLNNITVLHNFRFAEPVIVDRDKRNGPFRIIFFSRINRLKGYEMLFRFVRETTLDISVDFYGPVFSQDNEHFMNEINNCRGAAYKGEIEPGNVYNILKEYDLMVFPTQYFTEGLPGSVVDAAISGLPVIATGWKNASEFINHGVNGYIISFNEGYKEMCYYIDLLYHNPEKLVEMKEKALMTSKKYSSEMAWRILQEFLLS
jgi:glycosyltransferase involved in cell wall biosynthesis